MIAFPRSLQPASREQPVRDQASNRGEREREERLVQLLDGWMDGTEGGGRGVYTTSTPTVPGGSGSSHRKRTSLKSGDVRKWHSLDTRLDTELYNHYNQVVTLAYRLESSIPI